MAESGDQKNKWSFNQKINEKDYSLDVIFSDPPFIEG